MQGEDGNAVLPLGYPVFFKPASGTGSLDAPVLRTEIDMIELLKAAREHPYEQYMVEDYIAGRPCTVGLLEVGGKLTTLPVLEEVHTVPGTEGQTLLEWARRAEEAGFSSLGTIGRLVYQGYEELIALTAAASVTSRIRLTTSVLLAPLYANTALLAKQAASLDRLSAGRLVLGVALGGRDDDYSASGLPTEGRGRRLEEQLTEMKRIWSGEERGFAGAIGPEPVRGGGPELILGGSAEASFRRVARLADGWIMGGGTPEMFTQAAAGVDAAWQGAGRPGRPRKLSLAYFTLGSDARVQADVYLLHYYGFLGDFAGQIAAGAAVTAEMVRSYVAAFEAGGCDELILLPTASGLDQVELLAEVVA